ncbi:MAG: head decoration protein [Nanoarchaeota archaeon]|nr:head decoration protein [Nanoarchaeota archaeon]
MENGSATNQLNNNNMQITDYDNSIIFLRDNKYESGTYTNDAYTDVQLLKGTLMGRISADQELLPLVSGAADNSQFPVGILTRDTYVEAGDAATINICTAGEVAEEMLVLDAGDTLATVISGRSIRDRIGSDTVGIVLVSGTDLTAADNS